MVIFRRVRAILCCVTIAAKPLPKPRKHTNTPRFFFTLKKPTEGHALRAEAQYNGWARQILWANTLPEACPANALDASSEACVAWVQGFQRAHGLLEDGMLGPGTLLACISVYGGGRWVGPGPAILGGQEVDLGWPVWRMPTLGTVEQTNRALHPDLIALLSIGELDRVAKRRITIKHEGLRSHFSLDASRGIDGCSMVLQWADPLFATAFSPATQLGDYPVGREAIGVEIEDPLAPHYREREGKTRQRVREMTSAHIAGMTVRQLNLFPEQIAGLYRLLRTLCERLGVAFAFPRGVDGGFDTQCNHQKIVDFKGVAARFHWHVRASEPGAGLVEALPALFGEGGGGVLKKAVLQHQPPPQVVAKVVVQDRVTDGELERLGESWAQGATTGVEAVVGRFEARRFSVERAVRERREDGVNVGDLGSVEMGVRGVGGARAARLVELRERLRPHLRYPV